MIDLTIDHLMVLLAIQFLSACGTIGLMNKR